MAPSKSKRGRPAVTGLTRRQRDLLSILEHLFQENVIPPSVSELAKKMKLSPSTTQVHLQNLEKKGYLRREPGQARGLSLVHFREINAKDVVSIPILGRVEAGLPLDAPEFHDGEITVEKGLIGKNSVFALRVHGLSMENAGMDSGDVIIVRKQPLAQHGDIVVALVDGESTVKRLSITQEEIVLMPESNHPKFRPIPIRGDKPFELLGKVIAIRKF